nr:MAG TPA: hypothetical protein [Caudoviricetes sp.]
MEVHRVGRATGDQGRLCGIRKPHNHLLPA